MIHQVLAGERRREGRHTGDHRITLNGKAVPSRVPGQCAGLAFEAQGVNSPARPFSTSQLVPGRGWNIHRGRADIREFDGDGLGQPAADAGPARPGLGRQL